MQPLLSFAGRFVELAGKFGYDQDGGSLAGEGRADRGLDSVSSAGSSRQRQRIASDYSSQNAPQLWAGRAKPKIPKKLQLTPIEV